MVAPSTSSTNNQQFLINITSESIGLMVAQDVIRKIENGNMQKIIELQSKINGLDLEKKKVKGLIIEKKKGYNILDVFKAIIGVFVINFKKEANKKRK